MVAVGSLLFGQTQTGTITGKVTDEAGAVLPGVTVTLTSPDMIGLRTVVTTERGYYHFIMLPVGIYDIKYELEGFGTVELKEIRITIGFIARVAVTLSAVEETVIRTGESPVVDVESTTKETTFDQSQLDNLPTARDPWAIASGARGVQASKFSVAGVEGMQSYSITSHGGVSSETSYVLDGLVMNWAGGSGGSVMLYWGFSMYKEMASQYNALPPEINVGGMYQNMVTGSGGNDLHGQAMFLFLNQDLSWDNVSPQQAEQGIIANPIDISLDINGRVGGPIVKDKIWFFGAARYWKIDKVLMSAYTPTGMEPRIDENMISNVFGKVTYQINPTNTFMYNFNRNWKYRWHRAGETYYATDDATSVQKQPAYTTQGQWTSILSDKAFLDIRVGGMKGVFPMRHQPNLDVATAIAKEDIVLYTQWDSVSSTRLNPNWRLELNSAYSHFLDDFLGGCHSIKTGFQFSLLQNSYATTSNQWGINVQRYRNGVPKEVQLSNAPMEMQTFLYNLGLYFQDYFTIKDRLTLSLGARFDRWTGWVPEQTSEAGAWFPSYSTERIDGIPEWNNIAPRFGFSYDLLGDGKTVIKGNVSRYYRRIGMSTIENMNPMQVGYDKRTWTDLDGDDFADLNEMGPSTGWRIGKNRDYDRNSKEPYEDEFTLGVERELFTGFNLGAVFYYRRARNILDVSNVLLSPDNYTPVTIDNPLGGSLEVWNLKPEYRGLYLGIYTNSPLLDYEYKGLEFTWTKRYSHGWSLMGGFTYQKMYGGVTGDPNDPNTLINYKGYIATDSPYVFKLQGSYLLPYDIMLSGTYRYQTGYPLDRNLNVYGFTQGRITVKAAERGEYRLPDVNMLDLRLSKSLNIGDRSVELMFDLYNIFNINVATRDVSTIGVKLGYPVTIMTPRTVRFGTKFTF